MLHLARDTGAKLLQASTSEVYGDPAISPQKEDYWGNVNPIGIRSCYDEGKRCAETLFFDYYRQHGLDIKVVRIFNTYGPRMNPHDGRVVSNFIVQALKGQDITIFGEGLQTRSFCYVDDLIEGFIRFMDIPEGEKGAPGFPGPINLGNPVEFTMIELAQLVIQLTHSNSKLVYRPLPADDPMQRKPDITRAKELLEWEPKVTLREGLQQTIEQSGAEALLGMGDMLYMPSGTGFPIRVHGAFVSDEEVHRVVKYLKEQGGEPNYVEGLLEGGTVDGDDGDGTFGDTGGEKDALYDQAVEVVLKNRKASISLVQRHLKIGYNRAARLVEDMEKAGLVSSMSGSGQREILVPARAE